jgi:hypothetical protein
MKLRKFWIYLFVISLFVFLNISFSSAEQKKIMSAKLLLTPEVRLKDILKLHLDIVKLKPGEYFEIITDAQEAEKLRSLGYSLEVIHEDLVEFYRTGLNTSLDMGGYHTYEETGKFLDSMHAQYPEITTDTVCIGTSLEGRCIWAFKISDNPDSDEDEAEILFTGLHHAREPMTIEVLIYFIKYLCQNYGVDPKVTDLVDNTELWFVPIVNPDGYEYNRLIEPGGGGMWRKNMRDNGDGSFGVDLNRNYGFKWGYDDIGSSPYTNDETYRGISPFSEPEIQTIRDFVLSRDFVLGINYHSAAGMFLIPWGYDYIQPSDYLVDELCADTAHLLTGYQAGTGWAILYPTNGESDDWLRGEQTLKAKVFAYTTELGGDGFWPPKYQIGPVCAENLAANIFYARMAQRLKDRSIRYIETVPNATPLGATIAQDADTSLNLRIYNHDLSSNLDFNITDPDSSQILPFDFVFSDDLLNSKGFLASQESFTLLPKAHTSLITGSDWLRVSPKTGSISPGSYQDFTVILDATGLEGEYFGKDYNGGIVIATNNSRTAPYSDTSLVNLKLKVLSQYYDQYAKTHTSELYAGISNITNVGKKSNPGLGYLDDSVQYLYDGSLFLGYIRLPGDTIVQREMFNTFSLRAISRLLIDSTSDPRAIHSFYTDTTEDGDLGIKGEVIAPSIPDTSEFFIFRYKIFNLSGHSIDSICIGAAYDWDVYSWYNSSGIDENLNLVWQKSYNSPSRYAGLAYLSQDVPYGASVIRNETYIDPTGDFLTGDLYKIMSTPGLHPETRNRDLTTVMTAKKANLGVNDTVEVMMALAVTRDGLDDLKNSIVKARLFAGVSYRTGNVNGDDRVNLADAIYLANYVLKSGPSPLPYPEMGDVDCNSQIQLADVIYLANYILKSGPAPCIK